MSDSSFLFLRLRTLRWKKVRKFDGFLSFEAALRNDQSRDKVS